MTASSKICRHRTAMVSSTFGKTHLPWAEALSSPAGVDLPALRSRTAGTASWLRRGARDTELAGLSSVLPTPRRNGLCVTQAHPESAQLPAAPALLPVPAPAALGVQACSPPGGVAHKHFRPLVCTWSSPKPRGTQVGGTLCPFYSRGRARKGRSLTSLSAAILKFE